VRGNHDIDIVGVTHPDDDHRNALLYLIKFENYRRRRSLAASNDSR
jgi:beta-lactamase superfamily II metal-dependent hydrolase